MFGRAIQETPCEQRAWLSPWGSAKTAGCIHFWCCRMDLSTFSTAFSTEFVKKRGSFPRCFPLFPPSFPQKIEFWVIHDVFQNGKRGKIWREKGSKSLFLKRKSRPKIYFLAFSMEGFGEKCRRIFFFPKESRGLFFSFFTGFPLGYSAFSPLESEPLSFPHPAMYKTAVLKTVKKRTGAAAAKPQRHPFSERFTSYSGTRAARSGSRGSSCTHRRWW